MEDRRRCLRIPKNSEIVYEHLPGKKARLNVTEDISQGGIKFIAKEPIPQDSFLKIKLTFNKTSFSFEALAKVVRTKEMPGTGKYEIGVEFAEMGPEAAEYLMRCINAFK